MTRLCVPIFVNELEQARRDVASAAAAGADMVELRIDKLGDPGAAEVLLEDWMLPVIVTCRPTWEGGFSNLDDSARAALLAAAAREGAEFIDFELKSAEKNPELLKELRSSGTIQAREQLILSTHDFTGRPADPDQIVASMNQHDASVNKIVWQAGSILDNIQAFRLLAAAKRPTIALCMGEAGIASRLLAGKFGAFLTFAALGPGAGTAPGQPTLAEMKSLYRWNVITPVTKVFGVIGSPVVHSMSPALHNAAFTAVGYDGVYLPLLVDPPYEAFKAFLDEALGFPELDLSGLSVTIPHKENALRYLREAGAAVEELSVRIGVVNTILIHRDATGKPKFSGLNTDYAAILDVVTAALEIDRTNLAGMRVAVLGAGGTGRAAVAGFAEFGASVTVTNRTLERAQALANEFNGLSGTVVAEPIAALAGQKFDVIVNTTSVGMYPKIDVSPIDEYPPALDRKTLVFDTIYNPMKTRLMEQAAQVGAKTVGGVEMFIRQAAAQFEAWTGHQAPRAIMRKIVVDRLALSSETH
jgi:3-dehydroquinate dehydratase / shikimate dehydrogenase